VFENVAKEMHVEGALPAREENAGMTL